MKICSKNQEKSRKEVTDTHNTREEQVSQEMDLTGLRFLKPAPKELISNYLMKKMERKKLILKKFKLLIMLTY